MKFLEQSKDDIYTYVRSDSTEDKLIVTSVLVLDPLEGSSKFSAVPPESFHLASESFLFKDGSLKIPTKTSFTLGTAQDAIDFTHAKAQAILGIYKGIGALTN